MWALDHPKGLRENEILWMVEWILLKRALQALYKDGKFGKLPKDYNIYSNTKSPEIKYLTCHNFSKYKIFLIKDLTCRNLSYYALLR